MTVETPAAAIAPNAKLIAILCGVGAAACWGLGLVTARHGIAIGLSPADLAFHRFMWSGLIMLPFAWRWGLGDVGGIGWGVGVVLMILGGPGLSILSHAGFILAPLGHGAVIQPSTATLGGLLLATLVLREHPSRARIAGAFVIVVGLVLMGIDALINIGTHALGGDVAFVAAGMCWATMLTILRLRNIDSVRATVIISVLSLLIYAPLHALLFGFDNMIAVGWRENALQVVAQGILSGPLATYLSAYAASVLGTGRGASFSALVPGFTILIGVVALGEMPTLIQLAGLGVVALGFRLVMKP
ncbi:MAG TPA: DMT family transporter [Xanthobacteraceae bacterium]|nr:DMT family transporter [Xanthobacteraceae bacterium]